MSSKRRKAYQLITVLTLSLAMLATTATFTFARTQEEIDSDIEYVQQQLEQTEQKTQEVNQKMSELQGQIDETKAKADSLANEVTALDQQIVVNEQKLAEAQKKLEKETANLNKRLRNMYKNGTVGFVDVILSSENVVDLISNMDLVTRIFASDQDLVADLQKHYEETEALQAELKQQEAELTAKMQELRVAQDQLYGAYEQLGADKETVEAETANLQSKMSSLRSEVAVTPTPVPAPPTGGDDDPVNPAPPTSGNGSSVVAYALQFVGGSYVWGGTSLTGGCDCSGFTMGVYGAFGVSLPHYSESQTAYGTQVSLAQAQPGDLMWYPGHVGIYAGNGMMVHASDPSRGIVYEPVYANFSYFRIL